MAPFPNSIQPLGARWEANLQEEGQTGYGKYIFTRRDFDRGWAHACSRSSEMGTCSARVVGAVSHHPGQRIIDLLSETHQATCP